MWRITAVTLIVNVQRQAVNLVVWHMEVSFQVKTMSGFEEVKKSVKQRCFSCARPSAPLIYHPLETASPRKHEEHTRPCYDGSRNNGSCPPCVR